jgi:hypothetical protein
MGKALKCGGTERIESGFYLGNNNNQTNPVNIPMNSNHHLLVLLSGTNEGAVFIQFDRLNSLYQSSGVADYTGDVKGYLYIRYNNGVLSFYDGRGMYGFGSNSTPYRWVAI